MTILVTGGVGFVGVNIVKRFAEIKEKVVSLDMTLPDEMVYKYLNHCKDRISFYQGDIRDPKLLSEISREHKIDCIIHAAAITATHPEIEKEDFTATVNVNIMGTMNILKLAKDLSLRKFIYVSSGSAYGPREDIAEPIVENSPLVPRRLYPITKLCCELLCRRYSQIHDIKFVILRLSSPYGPMERRTSSRQIVSPICDYVNEVLEGKQLLVSGLDRCRDYTYIDDAIDAFVRVLQTELLPHDVYNISIGRNYTLKEIIDVLKKYFPELKYKITDEMTIANINEDTIRGPFDISRARKDFGFNPLYDLDKGIQKYIQWLHENSDIIG